MKTFIASFMLALLTAHPLTSSGQAGIENDPAYLPIDKVLDLKTIRPEVNVNLPHFLLKDALSELNGATNSLFEGIDIADLIKDVKLIRVVVIEANKTNRPALDKAMKALQNELEKKWTAIVNVPEDKDQVGVYAMSDPAGESTSGLAVLVYDGSDAVIANIVGHVSIGKLIKLASQSGKVPPEVLKKLQGLGDQKKQPKSAGGLNTNTASGSPQPQAKESPAK